VTGWLAFYLPSHPPVEQINLRIRWVNAPEPDPALFRGPVMFVCINQCFEVDELRRRFTTVEPIKTLTRFRRGVPIESYPVYKLAGPIGPPLDPP